MDNLPAHKNETVTKEMQRLGFKWIWNVPYAPEYNPIELDFSKVKQVFKKMRAQKMLGQRQETHEALAAMAMRAVGKQDVVNCIRHVNDLLK